LENESRRYVLHPQFLDDYIDLGIWSEINQIIGTTGMRFELYEPFDQTAFVVALSADEKRRLQKERGWNFAT
jgi:hypothetical protein